MKKICILLALLLVLLPASALAADDTEATPTPKSTATTSTYTTQDEPQESVQTGEDGEDDTGDEDSCSAVTLSIDNTNVYSGMDKAYKDGYAPTVSKGVATVVLPLIADGDIQGSAITVTPGLGDTSSSPFVYKNYEKTVELKDNSVNNSAVTVSSYLASFSFALAGDRINGVYPVTIDVSGQDTNGNAIEKSFTCYVTITDGKNPQTEESIQEETEKPESQPKIIVSGYSINPSSVEAGNEFTTTVTLKNTNEKKYVKNMLIMISCDSTDFTLLNDSNEIYIKKLGKGATQEIEIKYKTDLNTPEQTYNVTLTMEYDNSDAMTLNSTGTVPVDITQPLRVELETPEIESEVNAGDTMPLSFQVMNLGRSAVYNVRVELEAAGLIPSGTAFIGNMEAGTSGEADMDVFIGTKDMSEGYEGEDKYGYTSGTITLIYEDADGTEYTQETEISTMINEPVITTSADNTEEDPETAGQWWISIAIGGVIVAGLAVYLVMRKKRRGKDDADF